MSTCLIAGAASEVWEEPRCLDQFRTYHGNREATIGSSERRRTTSRGPAQLTSMRKSPPSIEAPQNNTSSQFFFLTFIKPSTTQASKYQVHEATHTHTTNTAPARPTQQCTSQSSSSPPLPLSGCRSRAQSRRKASLRAAFLHFRVRRLRRL